MSSFRRFAQKNNLDAEIYSEQPLKQAREDELSPGQLELGFDNWLKEVLEAALYIIPDFYADLESQIRTEIKNNPELENFHNDNENPEYVAKMLFLQACKEMLDFYTNLFADRKRMEQIRIK